MEIKSDSLNISTADRNEKGTQIDPEERPAERVLGIDVPITLSNGQTVSAYTHGEVADKKDGTVNINGTAIEFAEGYRGRCRLCKHFDNPQFRRWKHDVQLSTDKDRRGVLDFLRSKLLSDGYAAVIDSHQGPDGDLDVEHALMEFGFCRVLSHAYNDMFIVWPDAGCPTEDPTGKPIDPAPFSPRDSDAQREGDAGYDSILKAAQGGPVKRKAQRIDIFKKK